MKYDGNPDTNRLGYLELLNCKVQQIAECRAEIDQARDTGGLADRFLTAKAKQVGKFGRALSRELICGKHLRDIRYPAFTHDAGISRHNYIVGALESKTGLDCFPWARCLLDCANVNITSHRIRCLVA